jgi:acetylglutamate kinase
MPTRPSTAPVVLKFGGELLEEPARVAALASALVRLARAMPLVIVHGGGREIDAALARAGIEKRQVDGLRVTDEPTLDIVVGVLAGLINTRLVAVLAAAGIPAVGLTGADAGIGLVEPARRHLSANGTTVDLGRVGEPAGKDKPALLMDLCEKGYVPVVASIGAARDGRLFNVNADTLAGNLAGRLKSPRLVVAGATAGVLDGLGGTIANLSFGDVESLIAGGGATAGMIAKLSACRRAAEGGAEEVFIADGREAAALSVLVRYGRAAGAAKSTRIDHANASKRRHVFKRRQMKRKAS